MIGTTALADPPDPDDAGVPVGSDYSASFNMAGWRMTPAVSAGNIVGFLGWMEDTSGWGLNIQLIWFQRDGDSEWSAWGWSDPDVTGAVEWVKQAMGDASVFQNSPELGYTTGTSSPELAVSPDLMNKGFFANDPAISWVESLNDPADIAAFLADVGYPVAPLLVEKLVEDLPEGASPLDAMMNGMLVRAQWTFGQTIASINLGFVDLFCSCKITKGPWAPVIPKPPLTSVTLIRSVNGMCTWEFRTNSAFTRPVWQTGRWNWDCAGCGIAPPIAPEPGDEIVYVTVPCTAGLPPTPSGSAPDAIIPHS